MKTLSYKDKPIKVFGIPFFDEHKTLRRLPDELIEKLPNLSHLGKRCPGARLCFKTDAESFTVRAELKTLTPDVGMSIFSCQSLAVMIGDRKNFTSRTLIYPENYTEKAFSGTVKKGSLMEDVTIFLPRNEVVENIEIDFPDGAKIEEITPYAFGPAVFYGSSITEGGCCQNIFNAYNAILSNELDMDYYNLGFSGNAKGELIMADYINTIPMKLFVYDYDHNAPSNEHLLETHEAFFRKIREKNPDIPIVMMSRPNRSDDYERRLETVRKTYEKAVAKGDKNVYFVNGQDFFPDNIRLMCTVDNVHPNDLGFFFMAEALKPLFKKILGIK